MDYSSLEGLFVSLGEMAKRAEILYRAGKVGYFNFNLNLYCENKSFSFDYGFDTDKNHMKLGLNHTDAEREQINAKLNEFLRDLYTEKDEDYAELSDKLEHMNQELMEIERLANC